jgi:toxin ParE1/3/4
MADFRISGRADADLGDIADYTIAQFGIAQAQRYRDGLHDCFRTLAEHPNLGRAADTIARGLRRFEHESHVVFFVPVDAGILIVRVLHNRMDANEHLL